MPGLAAGFDGYADEAFPPAPALSAWLSRAQVSGFDAGFAEQAVAGLLGLAAAPVASLSYLYDFGEPPPAACLRADPVHLRTDGSGLLLFDAASFELGDSDSRSLAEALDAHLASDGWCLLQGHRYRWYLLGEQAPALETGPLPVRRGTLVSATPFTGDDAAAWAARLNELQMLMHAHPVNQARAAQGEVAVNSLWLWGGGSVQPEGQPRFTWLLANNACARGAARWRDLPDAALPADAAEFLSGLADDQQALLVLEDCRPAAAYDDFEAWSGAVQRLERRWFAPLLQALKAGHIDALELLPLNGSRYLLNRRGARAFWRKVRNYTGMNGFRRARAARV